MRAATAFRSATKALRQSRGSCYLTHGSDNYDHKALNNARRAEGRALIALEIEEAQEAQEPAKGSKEPKAPVTFSIIIATQVYENYGYRWKPKGGSEYRIALGSTKDVLALGYSGLCDLVQRSRKMVEHDDNEYNEYIVNWVVVQDGEYGGCDDEYGFSVYIEPTLLVL